MVCDRVDGLRTVLTGSLEELKTKYEQMDLAVSRLKEGADIIRATLNEVRLIQDADSSARRSQDIVDKMIDCAATLDSPASNPDFVLQELRQLDSAHRREVQTITEIKVRFHPATSH
jgi:autophagy-related protein 11